MTQAVSTFHLSHGPKNRPTLVFLPGALIPPNAIAPVTRIVKLRAIGVGWLEGAGPHDLHSVAARVANLLGELGPTVLVGHSVGTPIAALAASIDLRSTKPNVVGLVLSNSGANTKDMATSNQSLSVSVRHGVYRCGKPWPNARLEESVPPSL